jgi:hypothetical protein
MPRAKLDPLLTEYPGLKPVKWQSVMLAHKEARAIVLTDVLSAMI